MIKKKLHPVFVMIALALALNTQAKDKDSAQPWKTIFNGKNFSGWSLVGSKGSAIIEDSAFVCHRVSNTPEHTFIRTNKKYGDLQSRWYNPGSHSYQGRS